MVNWYQKIRLFDFLYDPCELGGIEHKTSHLSTICRRFVVQVSRKPELAVRRETGGLELDDPLIRDYKNNAAIAMPDHAPTRATADGT